jgi:hypothetical protein
MEWMATITGDHVGYPGFRVLGDFSPKKEKNLGEQKFACLLVSVRLECQNDSEQTCKSLFTKKTQFIATAF